MENSILGNIQIYLHWISKKLLVNDKIRNIQIREGEIYWCTLGQNIGDEENGKGGDFRRPVLVIKKFNNNLCWALPLSSKLKPNNKYYFNINFDSYERSLLLSQLRTVDTKRFGGEMGSISATLLAEIKSVIVEILMYNPVERGK